MSFLDRFKLQPKWRHADPAVRAAAVAELTDDPEHQSVLLELAGDEDLRVRRAALDRITTVPELVRFARAERDEDLRRGLADRLVDAATSPSGSDGDAALALEGLEDPRHLAAVARSSPHDTVRTAALGRVHDSRLLGNVARQAIHPQTALEAVARIADAAELLNVAVKTDHKDAGIAALERASETAGTRAEAREMLDGVANRARNKAVARRARAMVQAIEEAEAAERAALEQWQQRVASTLARVEALGAAPVTADTRVQLADAEAEWLELAGGASGVDADTNSRFGALVTEAHEAIERHERAEAERRAVEEHQAALRATRTSLIDRVNALRGDDVPDEIQKARSEWDALAGSGEDPELDARFTAAATGASARHANRQEAQRTHARLEELSAEAERLAGLDAAGFDDGAWERVGAEWSSLIAKADVESMDPAVAARYDAAVAAVHARAEERAAAAERTRRQQVQRIEQLIERVQKRSGAEDLTLREADRAARDLRGAVDAPPEIEDRDRQALVERLKAAQALIAPRVHELREMDEWKRFANAAVQEELIARTEALRARYNFDAEGGPTPQDVEKAARELHEIQERWKQVAEAPRAQAQTLWHRYRQAADPIQARAREFFAARSEERKSNLDRKLALIERAEALADSTDWIKTAEELKTLQHEWQQIGAVPRQDTRVTWKRFREACDRFFTRRNADLAQRKETWSANLARKEALCTRAEALATSRDWDKAAAEIRRLQAEWKTIGPVRRNKSEAIWHRFRAACDTFFDRYKRRDEIEIEARQADREGLVGEMEALVQPPSAEGAEAPAAPTALLDRVRALRTRWNQTTPVVRHGADPLSARFVEALERVMAAYPEEFRGTELDVDASRHKMEKLCAKVEAFVSEAPAAPANSSQALADMLREALASNTIGGRGSEEARWRAMGEDVRQAQSSWSRLVPVPGQAGRELTDRFHRACNRFFDQYRRHVPPQSQGPGRGRKELQIR